MTKAGPMLLALSLAGCAAAAPPAAAPSAGVVASNITRADYAGSGACAGCHPAVTAAWERSPMRSMTRLAPSVPVEPVFDGRQFQYKDDRVTLFAEGGERYMAVARGGGPPVLHRVTKVIGGRYREDFVGKRLAGASPGAPPDPGADERVLPVSYLLNGGGLRYKGYSVLVPERPYLGRGAVWRKTCIVCHNTLPHLTTLYDDLRDPSLTTGLPPAGDGSRPLKYLGSISDHLLPRAADVEIHVTSPEGLRRAVTAEIEALGEAPPGGEDVSGTLETAILATRKRFGQSHLIEVGIGCEACHGGSREHTVDPAKKPSFAPVSPFLSVTGPGGRPLSRAEQVNRVCARCHTVLFSGYRPTWEGGERAPGGADAPDADEEASASAAPSAPPGGSAINSGEARDFLLGGCASRMACTDCHDPHAPDGFGDRKAGIDGVCAKCHSQYSTPERIAAHTHHRADGPGSACLDCHMPRKNMGLGYRLTRYHRIGSPSDPERVERDRPVECALCHEDRTVQDLTDTMTAWWGRAYDRAALVRLYGPDLRESALLVTLSRGKPHEQAAAAAALAGRGRRDLAARLVPVLSNEIPLVRYFARDALERLIGAPFPWDVGAGDASRPAQARAWLAEHP